MLVDSISACNSWAWARLKPASKTSTHLGDGTQLLEPLLAVSRVYISRQVEWRTSKDSNSGPPIRNADIPSSVFTHVPD